MGQEIGSNSAGWFWLGVSREAAGRMMAEVVVSSEGQTGAGGSTSYMGHIHGWPGAAGCWQETSISPHGGLSTCCLSLLMTQRLPDPERASQETKEEAQCLLWPDSEARYGLLSYKLLVTQARSDSTWEGTTQGCGHQD